MKLQGYNEDESSFLNDSNKDNGLNVLLVSYLWILCGFSTNADLAREH